MLKSLPSPSGQARGDQRSATFLRNHARGIVACDFCVAVTATFRFLYVLVVMEHGSWILVHVNTTDHPTGPSISCARRFRPTMIIVS